MFTTFRAKLIAIVGVAASAFLISIAFSSVISTRVADQLEAIQLRFVPKMELGPQLEGQFEQLRRGLQDAVGARDGDALEGTRELYAALQQRLAAARDVLDAEASAQFRAALQDYYESAYDISRRMIESETGESLVMAMSAMQAKQTRCSLLLKKVTEFDRDELAHGFTAARQALQSAQRLRLLVGAGCLASTILLSLWLSRGVLRSLAQLRLGLERFGKGEFDRAIVVAGSEELAAVAHSANLMAQNLNTLQAERNHEDWLKTGLVGLANELRGELSPEEVGTRAVRFLARYLQVPVAALYYSDSGRVLRLAGEYGLAPMDPELAAAFSFRVGEGLVGQACLQDEITLVPDPPPNYLRIRTGVGEGSPRLLAFLPILHLGSVAGVLELGLFKPWSAEFAELLHSVRETLAIAIEVARTRASLNEMLAESQRQAERLRAQEEELQSTNEELHTQQEELRQTNEELTQQTEELEAQGKSLQQKNRELDQAGKVLTRQAEELKKASTYKSQFLANMSHELRTPLNSMLLLSSLLADNEGKNLTAKQVEFSRTIHSAGKDLLGLINQVLDLAKVEAGKQELRIETMRLAHVVEHAERVFRPLAQEKKLELIVQLAEGLPESIETDVQRVQQILNNLLANAIKFTQRGRVTLDVRRVSPGERARRSDLAPDRSVVFAVSDTGVGIAPEHQERIFAPFEQVEAASDRRFGGTGLGLTIARELAQLLGGSLELATTSSLGSTFACYLPLQAPATSASPRPPALNGSRSSGELSLALPSAAAQSSSTLSALAVPAAAAPSGVLPTAFAELVSPAATGEAYLLLVEDDPLFAEVVGDVIRRQGLVWERAVDGKTALELCQQRPPSGVILDLKLPDMDGWQVMERLRADPRTAGIPVHFVSAADASERALAMGAIGYLTKPATRQELTQVVNALAPRTQQHLQRVLVVEPDASRGDSLVGELSAEQLQVKHVADASAALQLLEQERFACIILDLSLEDGESLDFLRSIRERCGADAPSIIVYTARPLSKEEAKHLDAYAEAVVLKEGSSSERLLDEVRLFVRRLKGGLAPKRTGEARGLPPNVQLTGKRVLVVDDDMRTVYALSATLRAKGAEVLVADTGRAALGVLSRERRVDAVLMDIMMPEMDGYETMRRIRQEVRFSELPIIALTAKAMKGDRDRCLEVGASDYLPKPIDPERLLAMLHVRLSGQAEPPPEAAEAE
jgi:CheY-like chemotaxis protein/signal transduction histidine kinase